MTSFICRHRSWCRTRWSTAILSAREARSAHPSWRSCPASRRSIPIRRTTAVRSASSRRLRFRPTAPAARTCQMPYVRSAARSLTRTGSISRLRRFSASAATRSRISTSTFPANIRPRRTLTVCRCSAKPMSSARAPSAPSRKKRPTATRKNTCRSAIRPSPRRRRTGWRSAASTSSARPASTPAASSSFRRRTRSGTSAPCSTRRTTRTPNGSRRILNITPWRKTS